VKAKWFLLLIAVSLMLLTACVYVELDTHVTVSFASEGELMIEDVKIEPGTLLEVPEVPLREGYVFAGWYSDPELTTVWNFEYNNVTEEMTLYARWKVKTDFTQTFKVLSIGNSFSEDAHKYLWSIAQAYGIPEANIVIGNLYIGGAELAQHSTNILQNNANYTYQKYTSATKEDTSDVSIEAVLSYEEWDVVTFQQASYYSGLPSQYADYVYKLTNFVDAHATNPNVMIAWHMTWAYQQTSNHSGFLNYDRDQMTMYEGILNAVATKIDPMSRIQIVIPSGTAIQNARTSFVGDLLTRDGYHLSDPLGRYIAGLSFFKAITEFDIDALTFAPEGVSETHVLMAKEAVNQAIMNPREITNSTYTEAPEPEVIEVNGVPLTFAYQMGFWGSGATSVSPDTDALHDDFVAVSPIPKYLLPIGSEITIADGYQYRMIFFNKTGENTYQVVYRSDLIQQNYKVIDENFWEDYDYIGFNIASNPYSSLTGRVDEVAGYLGLYHPEGTGAGHVDTELTWSSGVYTVGGSQIEANVNYISSNPLTPDYYDFDTVFEVADGYKIAVVTLRFFEGQYEVLTVSNFQVEDIYIDQAYAEGVELFAFILTTSDEATDLSTIDPQIIIETHPGIVVHYDEAMTFISGYWETGKTAITTTNANMDFLNQYAASQPQSAHYYQDVTEITIADGYQVRIVYISYDGFGTYTVLSRSNWTTGVINIDDTFFGDATHIAFNISTVPTSNISGVLETLPTQFSFTRLEPTYALGYWNTGSSSLVSSTSYAGSSVIPRQFLPAGTVVTLDDGYQVRLIFLSYDSENGYMVLTRSENMTGTFVISDGFYQDYDYIAFNLSTLPTSNLTNVLDTLSSHMTLSTFNQSLVPHVDALSFVSGYWNNSAVSVTTGDTTFIKGFAASSVLSKTYVDAYTTLTIAEGYQVRVIYFDYSFNQYTVLYRTANLTGTITLDDTFWGDYQYVGFNISKVVSEDLSDALDMLPGLLTFS